MDKIMVLCALLGMPLLAQAEYGQNMGQGMGPGMGQGQGMGQQMGSQRPPGPPPEFFTACQGKKEGDRVTVNTPRGRLQGSCRLMFAPQGQNQQGGRSQQGSRLPGSGQGMQ